MFILIVYYDQGAFAQKLAPDLQDRGFSTTAVSADQLIGLLTTVAATGGRIDAILILGMLDEGIRVANAVRNIDDTLTFRDVVRVRTTPIMIQEMVGFPPVWNYRWNHAQSEEADSQLTMFGEDPPSSSDVTLPAWTTILRSRAASDMASEILAGILAWRQSLLAELDYVGFAVSESPSGPLEISHALRRKRRESEILAPEGTPGGLRRNQYLILAQDYLEGCDVFNELRWLLENYESLAAAEGIKPETVFQRFFEQHPHLVQRNMFDRVWAKPQLQRFEHPGTSYQPDFVLRPTVSAHMGTNWEILDLKLPAVPLHTGKFHPSYSSKLVSAMQQLRNYRNYFSRQDLETRRELLAKFGFQPVHPRIAVLIGRRDREVGLDQIQGDAGDLDIDVITYDDIVELEEKRLVLQSHVASIFAKRI